MNDLLEVLLFKEADRLVNVEAMCEVHVLGTVHLVYAPVVASSVRRLNRWRDDLGRHHYALLRLRLPNSQHADTQT